MILFWKVYFVNFLTSASGHPVFIPILNVAFRRAIDSSLSFSHGLRVWDPTATSSSFRPKYPRHFSPFPQKRRRKRSPWQYSVWRRKSDGDVRNFPDISGRKEREKRTSKKRDGGRWLTGIFFSPLGFSNFYTFFKKQKPLFWFSVKPMRRLWGLFLSPCAVNIPSLAWFPFVLFLFFRKISVFLHVR